MKCINCGFEYGDEYSFCPNCGKAPTEAEPQADAVPVSLNPTADIILTVLRDKLFLTACILISASCFFAIIGGSLPIINILLTIFLWITYAKSNNGIADSRSLRNISGTVYANYIIGNVVSGSLIALGGIFTAVFSTIPLNRVIMNEIMYEMEIIGVPEFLEYSQEFISLISMIIGPICIFAGIGVLLINIFGMRKIHRFVQSVYRGIDFQNSVFYKPRTARNWMIFFAVMSGLSALSALVSEATLGLSNGLDCATAIIASILINKYFVANQNNID